MKFVSSNYSAAEAALALYLEIVARLFTTAPLPSSSDGAGGRRRAAAAGLQEWVAGGGEGLLSATDSPGTADVWYAREGCCCVSLQHKFFPRFMAASNSMRYSSFVPFLFPSLSPIVLQ